MRAASELTVCPRCGELGRLRIYEVRGHLYRFVYHGGSRCYLGPVKPIYRTSASLRPLEPVTRVQIPAGAPPFKEKGLKRTSSLCVKIYTRPDGGQLITTPTILELSMAYVDRAARMAAEAVLRPLRCS